jgi:hypothetical protein
MRLEIAAPGCRSSVRRSTEPKCPLLFGDAAPFCALPIDEPAARVKTFHTFALAGTCRHAWRLKAERGRDLDAFGELLLATLRSDH